jgi:hypothetical protein
MKIVVLQIAMVFLFFGWSIPEKAVVCETNYVVEVLHPGIDMVETVDKTLVRSTCSLIEPAEFYMDVESVVCGDLQCRIDIIRIYWDELGFYKRIKLPNGVELEKAEGASFSQVDYKKMDSILSDRNSSLKDVQKYEVTGSETSEGVDALAGATIALDTKSYVKGAVWTCYTLWHWVNGNITTTIRDITGESMTLNALVNDLQENSMTKKIFALEQLIRLNFHESKVTNAVLQLKFEENLKLQKLIIDYIEQLPSVDYFEAIECLLKGENEKISVLALQSLLNTSKEPSEDFLNTLSKQLVSSNSFQQIDLFIRILEIKELVSPSINKHMLTILMQSDFILARRVYWFLSKQELSKQNKNQLQFFYNNNSEKL